MGITLGQLEKRLRGELDVIPSSSSRDIIRNALRDIYDTEEWGCFFIDSYIRTPAQILGTAAVLEFANTITLDSTTKTLLNNATNLPDKVPAEERQVRILSSKQTDRAFWYNIKSYDSITGIATLDIPFQDVDNAAAKIQMVKLYYNPPLIDIGTETSPNPVIDFKRFEYILSSLYNRRLCLDITLQELNRVDPIRERGGDPRAIVPKGIDSNGDMLYELYPIPLFERILRVKYMRTGLVPQKDTDQIPNFFSQDLVISRAKMRAYEWIMANGQKAGLKSVTQFANLIALANSPNNANSYVNLLARTKKRDEELYPKAYVGNFAETPYYDLDDLFGYRLGASYGETIIIDAQYPN